MPAASVVAASFDVVLHVRVTDSAGRPVAGAAVLTTLLWTSKSDYRRFASSRGLLLHANSEGELAVPITLDRHQRSAIRRNGNWASISVTAFDAAMRPISVATTSRYLGTRADQLAKARRMPHADLVRLVGVDIGFADRSADASGAEASVTSCTYYWDVDGYSNRYAQVGELHADSDVINARFTYGATADTTLDAAWRNGTGAWAISGGVHLETVQESSVYAETAGQSNYHWALRSQFRFVSEKLFKDCVGGPYRSWVGQQTVRALEWTGNGMTLSNTLTQPPRKSAYSATYGSRSGWSRSAGALVKWSASVTAFGATLGAQSGASSFVRIDYSFGPRIAHYLYGDTGLPSSSTRVFQDTP